MEVTPAIAQGENRKNQQNHRSPTLTKSFRGQRNWEPLQRSPESAGVCSPEAVHLLSAMTSWPVSRSSPASINARIVHEVEVLAQGFRYRSQVHKTLSAVAKIITGTN